MKKVLFAFAALTLFASCKDAKEKFVASLVDAVNAKDVQALTALYPDAAELGELVTLDASATPVFNETSEGTEVTISGVTFVLVNVGGKNFYVKSSKGLINVPQETMDLALATGWYNKELTDKENAEALADTDFPEYIKEKQQKMSDNQLTASKQKYAFEYFDDSDHSENNMMGCSYRVVVKNNSDVDISGSDYTLKVRFARSGFDTNFNEVSSTKNYDGKDVPAHGSVTYNNLGHEEYVEGTYKIPHPSIEFSPNFDMSQFGTKYTGNEYKEYLNQK